MHPGSQAGAIYPYPTTSGAAQGVKRKAWAGLKTLGGVLSKSASTFGPLRSAVDDVSRIVDIFESMALGPNVGDPLMDDLDTLFGDVAGYLQGPTSPSMMSSTRDFAEGIKKEMEIIQGKRQRTGASKLEEIAECEDEATECYVRIQRLLSRLALNANLGMWKTANEEVTERLLNKLPDSPAAKYCSSESTNLGRGECAKDTRIELLRQIRAWACDDKAEKVYWLNGMAGTGKTTIAYSLCKYLQTTQKLGASFFCSQRLSACRDVNRIVSSVAYRLSRFSPPFRQALSRALEQDGDACNQVIEQQFGDLLDAPLREITEAFPANVVVVIDALDECDDQGGVAKVITTLLSHAAELPVKFFVTSRPEPKIVDQMRKQEADGVRHELRLHELKSTVVRQDIATYLTAKLAPAGLSGEELSILVLRSGVLFIYAATVARFIEFDGFSGCKQRLQLVLDASATLTNESDEALDELYTTILQTGLEMKGLTRAEKAARETVLKHVVCAREPLSLDVMAGLLQVDNTVQVSAALRSLQSVLSIAESGVIGTLHESFPNYLLNPARSGRFYCDPGRHHARMAQQCFNLIKVPNPPFNICNLESSYLLDDEVSDIDRRVDQAISQALLYACRYWAAHLELADHIQDCSQPLYEFLSERLLLWMEVMNLKKHMWEGVDLLRKAHAWCRVNACRSNDLQLLVQDASRLVSVVLSSPALGSTPHIYISTLAFWPKSRLVTKHYHPRFSGLAMVTGTAVESHQPPPAAKLQISSEGIWNFAHSPNTKRIAFIDKDRNVAVWNICTGRCEVSFGGDHFRFNTIAFSHDGLHVILGCDDGAICIWDTQTYQMVGDPLRCHSTAAVASIACSPDGDHIAAGSRHNTVYIWNRHTRQIIASLTSHANYFQSVAYSSDSAYIASGSDDGTIRIWSVHAGHMLEHELSGHTGAVYSVAFSPGGTHVVSGSECGVHIWNARTGELVGEPSEEHREMTVNSVQYSPSGLHYASGSSSGTFRIWGLLAGRAVTQLQVDRDYFEDPSPSTWVAYSLRGEQVLSCSELGTLYIWDASVAKTDVQTRVGNSANVERTLHTIDLDRASDNPDIVESVKKVGEAHTSRTADKSPEGHHKEVSALAYSPDGAYIVSGSDYNTLCLWDARTGRRVGQPLEGHTGIISSVSVSPDGTHIVSGSHDNTICIWDVHTCATLGTPLIGHTGGVTSVSYSPDGAHIASGSWDKTIRIWDAYTGRVVGPPLVGHKYEVNSVSYSPGGAFLVSGSYDGTVRIWNTQTGKTVGHPLLGHEDRVESVAYSPNSLYIVSRSNNTACVWDAYTGSMIGQPHKFCRDQFYSISYSSAGANLSVSFLNGAIHVSHTYADRDLVAPFRLLDHGGNDGDNEYLTTCVFSPDGTYVASGYEDGTIRLSSIHVRQLLDAEMKSHGDQPCAVEQCTCSACAFHSDWGTWKLDKDGWVTTGNSQKLIWVPDNLRKSLQLPHNTTLISRGGALQLDFSSAKVGTSWSECYSP
ncbi:hypothetical protein FRC09_016745 [Ceratobasidium sp. 395]|nr:hypothetical protein FRC09_016745 [Ceratobasidium sp. 395]